MRSVFVQEMLLFRCFPLVIFAIFCAKCFLVFPVLELFWALRPSRLTPWNEEESFSQKIAKITKTIPGWKADARSHLFISEGVEVHQVNLETKIILVILLENCKDISHDNSDAKERTHGASSSLAQRSKCIG